MFFVGFRTSNLPTFFWTNIWSQKLVILDWWSETPYTSTPNAGTSIWREQSKSNVHTMIPLTTESPTKSWQFNNNTISGLANFWGKEKTQCARGIHRQNYISKYIKLVILELCSDHFLAGFASQGVVNKDRTVKNQAYMYDMCEWGLLWVALVLQSLLKTLY